MERTAVHCTEQCWEVSKCKMIIYFRHFLKRALMWCGMFMSVGSDYDFQKYGLPCLWSCLRRQQVECVTHSCKVCVERQNEYFTDTWFEVIDVTTHFVEEVTELSTICGLTSLKDRPNENTSSDINDCTCLQCLGLVIGRLTKRLQNINRANMQQVQSVEKKRNDGSDL